MAAVLVIDDDSTLRQLIAFALENAGHRVVQVAHGRESMAVLKRQSVDLIITDLVMPDDSLDHVLALRTEFPRLPLILISGLVPNSPRLKAATETLQAQCTLPKPFKVPALLAAIESVLVDAGPSGAIGVDESAPGKSQPAFDSPPTPVRK